MMVWKMSVGESRVNSRSLTEEGASTRRLEVSGWKTKESSVGRLTEFARRKTDLDVYGTRECEHACVRSVRWQKCMACCKTVLRECEHACV